MLHVVPRTINMAIETITKEIEILITPKVFCTITDIAHILNLDNLPPN